MRRSHFEIMAAMATAAIARPSDPDLIIIDESSDIHPEIWTDRTPTARYVKYNPPMHQLKSAYVNRPISHRVIQLEAGAAQHFETPKPLTKRQKRRAKGKHHG